MLYHAELSDREFGSTLLRVDALQAWAKSNGLYLATTPSLDGFEFVQVEALLAAIERHLANLTPDQALQIVLNTPALLADPAISRYPNDIDPVTCRWLIGANAHNQWRKTVSVAISAGDLTLLDFASRLPIDEAVQPASDAKDLELLATREELVKAFGKFTGMDLSWFNNLADSPKLKAACKIAGSGGKGGTQPLFCPVEVTRWLIDPKRKKGSVVSELTALRMLKAHFPAAYQAHPELHPN